MAKKRSREHDRSSSGPPPEFAPVEPRGHALDAITVTFLEHPRIVALVQQTREREEIIPPESRQELKAQLRARPPEQFLDEVRPVVAEVLALVEDELLSEALPGGVPEAGGNETTPATAHSEAAPILERLLAGVPEPADALEHLSRVVARYIVAGLLEPPEPWRPAAGGVFALPMDDGETVVVAVATAATDLDDLVRQLRQQWRAQFLHGTRDREPDTLAETMWLRHCKRVLERDEDPEGTSYRRLAELSFAIWPKTRPRADEYSPAYERALDRRAEQIRANMGSYEDWQGRWNTTPDTPPSQPPKT